MNLSNEKVLILVWGGIATPVLIATVKWLYSAVRYKAKKEEIEALIDNGTYAAADLENEVVTYMAQRSISQDNFFEILIENSIHPLVVAAVIGTFESFTTINFIVSLSTLIFLIIFEFHLIDYFKRDKRLAILLLLIWGMFYLIESYSYSLIENREKQSHCCIDSDSTFQKPSRPLDTTAIKPQDSSSTSIKQIVAKDTTS